MFEMLIHLLEVFSFEVFLITHVHKLMKTRIRHQNKRM